MASRRLLKKQITAILTQIMDECILCNILLEKFDNNTLDEFAARIVELHDESIRRICNPEGTKDRKRTKMYFDAIINDFNRKTLDIITDMNKISD